MAIDSVGSNSRDGTQETRRKLLELEKDRELDKTEKRYREQIEKNQEQKNKSLTEIYENQTNSIEEKRKASDERLRQINLAAEQRAKELEASAGRTSYEAQKRFQEKAANLNRVTKDLEDQRTILMKRHSDSMKKLEVDKNIAAALANRKAAEQTAKIYNTYTDKADQLQEFSNQQLGTMQADFESEKENLKADREYEISRLLFEEEKDKTDITKRINNEKRKASEMLENERINIEKRKNDLHSEFSDESTNLNLGYRSAINKELIRGREKVQKTKNYYEQELYNTTKDSDRLVDNKNKQIQEKLVALEGDAKVKEALAKNTYETQKQVALENRQAAIEKIKKENKTIKEAMDADAKQRTQDLIDTHHKQYEVQSKSLTEELMRQEQLGRKTINSTKDQLALDLANHTNKARDPFYRIHQINSSISESPTEYVIKIKVPEHEQSSVRVTAQPNSLTVSGSRRYQDRAVSEESGKQFTTNSYQSYSESFPIVGKILMNKLVKSYNNGILTFKVPRE